MQRQERWPIVRLGTLAEFRNGVNYNKSNFGKGIKVIGVSDFQDHVRASFDELEEINPDGVVRKEHLLRDGDVLFVRSNGNRDLIGRSLFVAGLSENVTHSAFSIRLRFTSTRCCPRFYAYLFRSRLIRQALSLFGGGTNISNLNQGILEQLAVPLPPRTEQERIASILSAYDDLIENNTRRTKILDDMAQMIYREWFANFRFPGHENVRMVGSELGPLPEGWLVKSVDDIGDVKGGKRLPKGKGVQDTITTHPYLRVKDMSESGVDIEGIQYIDDAAFEAVKRYTISSDDIYVSIAGTIGRVGVIPRSLCGANLTENAAKITNIRGIHRDLLLCHLQGSQGQAQVSSKVVGTSQPKLALFRIGEIKVPVPPLSLQEKLGPVLADYRSLIETLQRSNKNLRTTRDLLLPKLISGEIPVRAADDTAAEIMEATA